MTDLLEAAGLPNRGRLHVLGLRIREDDVPVRCMVVAAQKPDGSWLMEIEGLEGSAVLLGQESLVGFAQAIVAKARGQRPGGTDG